MKAEAQEQWRCALRWLRRSAWTLLIFCPPLSLLAQPTIPAFETNATEAERARSIVLSNLEDDPATVFVYSNHSYWTTKRSYWLLIREKSIWRKAQWIVTYHNRNKDRIKRISKKRLPLGGDVDSLIIELNTQGFWTIDQDSLNISEKRLNDSTMMSTNISDGCYQEIEVLHQGQYRVLGAYESEQLQEFVYIPARERFIRCAGALRKALFLE